VLFHIVLSTKRVVAELASKWLYYSVGSDMGRQVGFIFEGFAADVTLKRSLARVQHTMLG
jgi:hypothetical protein